MTTSAEWSQSVFSCTFECHGKRLIAPNRDFPYEGLAVHQDAENWKLVDCVAVGLFQPDGVFLPLVPAPGAASVTVDPWQVRYEYIGNVPSMEEPVEVRLFVTYYLASHAVDERPAGSITFYIPPRRRSHLQLTLLIQPFLDIRHMYSGDEFAACRLDVDERGLLAIQGKGREIVFFLPPGSLRILEPAERLSWYYKLGTGYRKEVFKPAAGRMETQFIGESRKVAAFFNLEAPVGKGRFALNLSFQCRMASDPARVPAPAAIRGHLRQAHRMDRKQLLAIEHAISLPHDLPLRSAILGRIVALTKFKTVIERPDCKGPAEVPHAGAWWFKTPWYRDVFEGILGSFETLMCLPDERAKVGAILDLALASYHGETGLISSREPERKGDFPPYNSVDATLLCLLAAHGYAQRIGDVDLGRRALDRTLQSLACFREHFAVPQGARPSEGPPRLDPATGLLLATPHHSWIDTHSQEIEYAGWRLAELPNRASAATVRDLYDYLGSQAAVESALTTASFFLPEINAQWIAVLGAALTTSEQLDSSNSLAGCQELVAVHARARKHFKEVFWNSHRRFLFNLVHESRIVCDPLECEAAVTATALLGMPLFTPDELQSVWQHAQRTLLVHRRLQIYGDERLPFGLLVRNDDRRIYYGDREYHSDVTWPRSTRYLIQLLDLLGESELVRDILINNLDHQMSEAALFYNQELFSRPCGNNPAPEERTHSNPVPVKNPVQFWSQWCDGYLEFFGEKHDQI
jgi:glycogen debranching enzyme